MKEISDEAGKNVIHINNQIIPNFENFLICIKIHPVDTVRIRNFNISVEDKIFNNSVPVKRRISGTEYVFANPTGEILIYRDIVKSELCSGDKPADTHEIHKEGNYIDSLKISRIRKAGKDKGKWIKIRTSFKKNSKDTINDQKRAHHN